MPATADAHRDVVTSGRRARWWQGYLRRSPGIVAAIAALPLALTACSGSSSSETSAEATSGATTLKPVEKSMWGYGGVVQAPDGAIWKVATSAKKDTGPDTGAFDQLVLLLGVEDIVATKRFYVEHGLTVGRSFARKYVEFAMPSSPVKLALYGRKALAKDAGVAPDGTGSHRLTINADNGPLTDPDGFAWEKPSP